MKYYTGIGSRKTPHLIQNIMTQIAEILDRMNYVLRSGGANGADFAFEMGANNDKKEIYLPWPWFNGNTSTLTYTDEAMILAEKFHPAWDNCSNAARKMMARNVHQVLGRDLKTPSEFLICWTEGGKLTGGTSQALRIAKEYDVPVYNLAIKEDCERLKFKLDSLVHIFKNEQIV